MITSKQILHIIETYIKSKKVFNLQVDIYENPTSSDITSMIKTAREEVRKFDRVRFIADNNSKKVYVADSYNIIHDHMYTALGMTPNSFFNLSYPNLLDGTATLSSGSFVMTNWDRFGMQINKIDLLDTRLWFEKVFSYNWSWVDRYIKGCSKFVEQKKIKFEDKLKSIK